MTDEQIYELWVKAINDDSANTVNEELFAFARAIAKAEREVCMSALARANEQAEHFERLWYLAKEDAKRYLFSKTLEGRVLTMETFKNLGAAELDQVLDDAMEERG